VAHENLEVIRRGFDAWVRGDLDALFAEFDPEIVWDTSNFRNWPESSYYGVDGVRTFLTEWLEVWSDYSFDVEELLLAPDGRVVSLITHHGRGAGSGVPLDLEMAQVATVREGKIVRLDSYGDRSEALEAAGLRGGRDAEPP
jgi:ketosteroid isomerase-like protein